MKVKTNPKDQILNLNSHFITHHLESVRFYLKNLKSKTKSNLSVDTNIFIGGIEKKLAELSQYIEYERKLTKLKDTFCNKSDSNKDPR